MQLWSFQILKLLRRKWNQPQLKKVQIDFIGHIFAMLMMLTANIHWCTEPEVSKEKAKPEPSRKVKWWQLFLLFNMHISKRVSHTEKWLNLAQRLKRRQEKRSQNQHQLKKVQSSCSVFEKVIVKDPDSLINFMRFIFWNIILQIHPLRCKFVW